MENPLTRADILSSPNFIRSTSPLKSSFSSQSPDILSTAVLHKRRPEKRVRFALKLESVEENSLPSSREVSPILVSKSSKRVTEPWRQNGALYGTYVEYLENQDVFTSNEFQIRRTSSASPPHAPEPGAEPPTYTHTFVIQSKSPELVIDSITVSAPPSHLPRILHRTNRTNRHQLPEFDSYVKQRLSLSPSPRITSRKKLTDPSNQKTYYGTVHAALKRAELNLPPTNGLHANNRFLRPDNSFGSKFVNDHFQPKKLTEIIPKPLPGVNNQINHFSERSILPNYSKKPRMHNRINRTNDELNTDTSYFFQNHGTDHLFQPIIHPNR